jgi:hypothetical protein
MPTSYPAEFRRRAIALVSPRSECPSRVSPCEVPAFATVFVVAAVFLAFASIF